VLELWQAEWCPHSHGVRLRLIELEALLHGADSIVDHLDAQRAEPADAAGHRAQMRVEWPHRLELEGA
jgi:hypothetical protein